MSITQVYANLISKFEDAPDRFEWTIKEVYTRLLSNGSNALDLGAHTGKHTIPMAQAVGVEGQVFAFEPIQEKFVLLLNNLSKESLFNVGAFNVCCSRSNEVVDFVYLPTDPGKSAIHVRKVLETEGVQKVVRPCLAVRLDDFLSNVDRLEFIKMDIEGAEFEAMLGAVDLISRTRPIIHMEIGPPSLEAFGTQPEEIFDFLSQNRYEMVDVFGIELSAKDEFLESVRARGAYDYFAIPVGDSRKSFVQTLSARMWGLE